MKKLCLILVVIFVLFMVMPTSAQNRIGIVGGLNIAKLQTEEAEAGENEGKFTNRAAFGVGGVLDFSLSKNIALHLEPMYLQKGSKIELTGGEAKEKLAYLDVPVSLKLALGSSTIRPYVIAGPTVGFLLSAKSGNVDIKNNVKKLDFGLDFGAGVSFPAGNNSLFVEGLYALGLANINDLKKVGESDEVKTRGIQIMAGLTFPLGGQ